MKFRPSKTPLFSAFQRLAAIAAISNDPKMPPSDEILGMGNFRNGISRRNFLKGIGAFSAITAFGALPTSFQKKPGAKIVIIGGGIAGLNTAFKLKKAGIASVVYEASSRTGGRIFTCKDIIAPGLSTELGGEFIDSTHSEMLSLATEFGLEFGDRRSESEKTLISRAYFFGGKFHSEGEIIEAIRPFIQRIQADATLIPVQIGRDYQYPSNITNFDTLSLSDYFHSMEMTGWLKDLLETAYSTEFGLDISEQSALNFLTLFSPDISKGFDVFGSSDEKYVIRGGNSRITEELSKRLSDQIHLSHKLEAVKTNGKGYTLTFNAEGKVKDVEADIVVISIPFSVLRDVSMNVDLPDWKTKAIKELGYGTNTKVMVGFSKRLWRSQGYIGEVFSDENFQLIWDNSQLQGGEAGGLTSFSGGTKGVEAGKGTFDFQVKKSMQGIEKIFPGISANMNGNIQRFNWSSNPYAKGSYSAYKPGQWTSIRGAEGKSIGNLFFAGEHCSVEYQGFMNGATDSGKKAAEDIIKLLD